MKTIKTNCKCYECKFSVARVIIFDSSDAPNATLNEIFCKQLGRVILRNEEITSIKEMACNCFEKRSEPIPFKGEILEFKEKEQV
ncbi:unnamed protein product [marine sediment metagenome]|uniref:Uncharacterized protein n=1 Tax=marine sediment metagenome TaxID=412755 RepID=X1G4F3_9ZZZZ